MPAPPSVTPWTVADRRGGAVLTRVAVTVALVPALLALLSAFLLAGAAAARATGAAWQSPIGTASSPTRVLRPFVAPTGPYGPGHRGADLSAAPGAAVQAAGPGVVSFAGPVAGRGVVAVVHADGMRTTYEPVDPLVHRGQRVARGQVLARVARGPRHCGAVTCLHWGAITADGRYLDPMTLLAHRTVVLLPVPARPQPAAALVGGRQGGGTLTGPDRSAVRGPPSGPGADRAPALAGRQVSVGATAGVAAAVGGTSLLVRRGRRSPRRRVGRSAPTR